MGMMNNMGGAMPMGGNMMMGGGMMGGGMNMPMMGINGNGFTPQMNMNNGINGFHFNAAAPQNANNQFNDAYDRQPVNPNRQRGRKPRAPDYRYL